MARPPARIQLSGEEESVLRGWTRKGSAEQRLADRARIILLSHEGMRVEKIAESFAVVSHDSSWRVRPGNSFGSARTECPDKITGMHRNS